ncbi:uncharacterized protein N0V96_004081 [Colletotrichum fioriniae]|uniref:uncharacterized protein n=1 Tax=Colletotrichum fioriniae TaxID=710243 RepID=UPI0032DBD88E|nr:hypothetical protein N0V96_004081 [Colletotrichum fioriniae]
MWKNSHAVDMNMQFQFPPSAYIAGPITPTTPIIYGNGTMLSDIGEVTEAESTPGRRSRPTSVIWSRPNNRSGDDSRQPQSPTKMLESLKKRAAQATRSRRSSVESTSTITTTQDQNAMFADFDDTVSVDDSNFQGDDEESNNGTVPRRSASAMGAAGGYRQPYSVRKNVHDATLERLNSGGEGQSRYKAAQEIGLEPLGEDEVAQEFHSGSDSTKRESLLSPALSSSSRDRPLVRSASVAQMRDLKGQVQDLKGKISSLREQARADTMRRRSLQSLRTPSPFTHAQVDQWYAKSQEEQSPPLTATSDKNPWNADAVSVDGLVQERGFPSDVLVELQEPSIAEDNESVADEYDAAQEAIRLEERQKALDAMEANKGQDDAVDDDDDISDMHTEDGFEDSVQVQEGDGYDSESGDSLYHDTVQTFMSHEDREDAFDYEHFFLHSALGNLSQQRRGSVSSESSVETTRGPMTSDESIRPRSHHRRGSGDTTSTIESFATARSGRGSRVSTNDVSDDLRHGILTPPSVSPISEHTESPPTAKRSTIGSTMGGEDVLEELRTRARAGSTVYRRPMSTQATMGHRPSTASFDSTGTNRSFPLVGKARVSVGVLTPQGSPELELKTISDALMSETASICDKESMHTPDQLAPMEALAKEDQILVERFVASLGRCVLAMSEAGKASSESRMYRRRIDAARRILEGMGETS